jgi:Ca2+-binding RTX toxin-like protein
MVIKHITGNKTTTQLISGNSATTWKLDADARITTGSDFYALTDYNMKTGAVASGQPIIVAGDITAKQQQAVGLYGIHDLTIAATSVIKAQSGAIQLNATESGNHIINNGSIRSTTSSAISSEGSFSVENNGTISAIQGIRFIVENGRKTLTLTNGEDGAITCSDWGAQLSGSAKIDNQGTISAMVGIGITKGTLNLVNSGSIESSNSSIRAEADNFRITNEKSGAMSGTVAIYSTGDDGIIKNYGTITSDNEGVELSGASDLINMKSGTIDASIIGVRLLHASASVTNNGTIDSGGRGVTMEAAKTVLTNSGQIDAVGYAVDIAATGSKIVNQTNGNIHSDSYAVMFSYGSGKSTFTNEGTVTSSGGYAVYDADGITTVVNKGSITGDISLGNRADTFRNSGGTVTGTIYGGAGDDLYVVDKTSLTLLEFDGQGKDTVRSSVSWTLGTGFETLELTGSGAISAYGNDQANTLVGNSRPNHLHGYDGNDRMTGGKGADTFHFETGTGKDTITDFTDGADRIDLTEYGTTGIGDLTIVYDSKGALITLGDGDTIRLLNIDHGIGAADFIFA